MVDKVNVIQYFFNIDYSGWYIGKVWREIQIWMLLFTGGLFYSHHNNNVEEEFLRKRKDEMEWRKEELENDIGEIKKFEPELVIKPSFGFVDEREDWVSTSYPSKRLIVSSEKGAIFYGGKEDQLKIQLKKEKGYPWE